MAYTTNPSLLAALKRGDEVSWRQFYDTYRPLIVFCGRSRLKAAELDDLVQIVMVKVFNARERFRYDRSRGRFRSFLGRVVHNAVVDIRRRRPGGAPPADLEYDEFAAEWDREWRRHIMDQALEILKSRVSEVTFQAFTLYALQGRPAREVAGFLGLRLAQVYQAKLRCGLRMRRILDELRRDE